MKGLVLLYRFGKSITIKEYDIQEDYHNHYIVDTNQWEKIGILKQYVGKICEQIGYREAMCEGARVSRDFSVDLPYELMHQWYNAHYQKGYFIFINKTKFDADPMYYYNMIRDYDK